MKYKSTLLAEASGSVGGLVFAHNKGGMYIRARGRPVNRLSEFQRKVRQLLNQAANRWSAHLTPDQRARWYDYAEVVTLHNTLGAQIHIGGNAHYIRSWVARRYLEMPIRDDAPANFNLGEFTPPTLLVTPVGQLGYISFNVDDDWSHEDGAALGYYFSRPGPATREYYRYNYRYQGRTLGSSSSPPTSPISVPMPLTVYTGQRINLRTIITRSDGRLSLPAIATTLVHTLP